MGVDAETNVASVEIRSRRTWLPNVLGSHTWLPLPTGWSQRRVCRGYIPQLTCPHLAEGEGFEPSEGFPSHDFQSRQDVLRLSTVVHTCWSEGVQNPWASRLDRLSASDWRSVRRSKLAFVCGAHSEPCRVIRTSLSIAPPGIMTPSSCDRLNTVKVIRFVGLTDGRVIGHHVTTARRSMVAEVSEEFLVLLEALLKPSAVLRVELLDTRPLALAHEPQPTAAQYVCPFRAVWAGPVSSWWSALKDTASACGVMASRLTWCR